MPTPISCDGGVSAIANVTVKACPICGAEIAPRAGGGRRRVYCSTQCSQRAFGLRRAEREGRESRRRSWDTSPRSCSGCGKPYSPEDWPADKSRSQCRACRNAGALRVHHERKTDPDYQKKRVESNRRWREANPEKHKEMYTAWRRANPEKLLAQHLLREYGLKLDEYRQMEERQNGCCAICARPPGKRALFVDHDHQTGLVRGLLCGPCNSGVGYLGDDPERLRAAVRYLEESP